MTSINAQIVTSGIVTNCIVVDGTAALSNGGATLTWTGGSITAPSKSTFMMQAGAGIGWTLSNGVLVAPTAPTPPALTQAQLMAYANGKLASRMATPRTYALGSGISVKADATTATGADLLSLNVWGIANPTAAQPWIDDFGVVTPITGAEAVTLANAVLSYGQSVYAILASAMTGISGGTITTTAQVDALAWPT